MIAASGRRLLLVEDDGVTAQLERESLELRGYRVTVAASGEEAIRITREDSSVDLVLMDIGLGAGIDGVDAANAILAKRHVPILFISSLTDGNVLRRIEGLNAYGFVVKDSGEAVLLAAVAMALRRADCEGESQSHESANRGPLPGHEAWPLTETSSQEGFDVDFKIVAERVAEESSAKLADWLRDMTCHSREKAEWSRLMSEKETQLREAHHRIKNNIASLESLLVMQSDSLHNPEAASALREAVSRMESMRVLYDLLLISDDCSQVNVKDYIDSLVDASISMFPTSTKIMVSKRIDDFMLDSKRLASFGIIVNELLTNTMKYAFAGRQAGSITVEVKQVAGQMVLTVSDDGQGLPSGFELKKSGGFGLSLVSLVSEQLGGTFSITSDHGTRSLVKVCCGDRPDRDVKRASGS